MAVLGEVNTQTLFNQGGPDLMALLAIRNVQGGDTLDVAQLSISPAFLFVKRAILLSVGGSAGLANVAGTIVTIPAGVPANSSGYLLVSGC